MKAFKRKLNLTKIQRCTSSYDGCKIHLYFKLGGPGQEGCLLLFRIFLLLACLHFLLFFLIEDGVAVQEALFVKTKQKTVPNVFVNGKHVGGCDATLLAHKDGRLAELLHGVQYDYDLIVIGGGSGGLAASKVSDCFVVYYFDHYSFIFCNLGNLLCLK